MQAFGRYNPIINFIFFAIVIFFTMVLMNPIYLAISFVMSTGYAILVSGKRAIKLFCMVLPFAMLSILINVLFNHRGNTILFYFTSGNPFTLESLIFGFSSAMMIASTILWFHSFHHLMTSDKLLYVFGRVVPSFSLLLSMTFRFIPRFVNDMKELINGQKCIGNDIHQGNFFHRLKTAGTVLSAETSLAFENSIDTATSMHMRGFHGKKRSSFRLYQMTRKDIYFLFILVILLLFLLVGIYQNYAYYRFFPSFQIGEIRLQTILMIGGYIFVVSMPLMLEVKEMIQWQKLK